MVQALQASQWAWVQAGFIGLYFVLCHVGHYALWRVAKTLWDDRVGRDKIDDDMRERDIAAKEAQRLANEKTADAVMRMNDVNGRLAVQLETIREMLLRRGR